MERCYLLDMRSFGDRMQDLEQYKVLKRRSLLCLDEERLQKVNRMKAENSIRLSIGAGLLIQKALRDYLKDPLGCPPREKMQTMLFTELLEELEKKKKISVEYYYGEKGKPYWKEYPINFSLSHSKDFVLCVVTKEEVGVDIQYETGLDYQKIGKRYFSEREQKQILLGENEEACKELFFRLWCRKEAYGKVMGGGLPQTLSIDMSGKDPAVEGVFFEDGTVTLGQERYFLSICKRMS